MSHIVSTDDEFFFSSNMLEGPAPYSWRSVTSADVLKALEGTLLGGIVSALSKNYRPTGPLPIMLLQGITMMSLGLTHRGTPEIIERHRKISIGPEPIQ